MHRIPLLKQIDQYVQRYPEEGDVISHFRRFVEEHEDCFQRSLSVGHITGSAWIVDALGCATLLIHHHKLNRWLQAGGHADGQTDVISVARREAWEETGLADLVVGEKGAIFDLDIHQIPARHEVSAHFHYDVRFLFRYDGSIERPPVSGEGLELAWVTWDRLEDYKADPSMLRMREKFLQTDHSSHFRTA